MCSPFLKMKYNSHMASKNGWNWVSILKVHRRITSICVCQDIIKRQTRDISSIPQDDISLSPNIVSCFPQLSTCGYAGKWKFLSMCGRWWLPQTACLTVLFWPSHVSLCGADPLLLCSNARHSIMGWIVCGSLESLSLLFCYLVCETGSHTVTKAVLQLVILLP